MEQVNQSLVELKESIDSGHVCRNDMWFHFGTVVIWNIDEGMYALWIMYPLKRRKETTLYRKSTIRRSPSVVVVRLPRGSTDVIVGTWSADGRAAYSLNSHRTNAPSTIVRDRRRFGGVLWACMMIPAKSHNLTNYNIPAHAVKVETEYISILFYSILLYSTLLYSTLLYSTLLYSTLLYSTLLYSTLLYSTLLYSTLLYSTLLYSYSLVCVV